VHSAAGAIYETLLHEQVTNENRATALSLGSMAMQSAGAIGAVTLGAIASGLSTGTAMIVGGIVLALAAPLFLVRERVSVAAGPAGPRSAGR
jgi:predicted MFS family arabinose efflux permease